LQGRLPLDSVLSKSLLAESRKSSRSRIKFTSEFYIAQKFQLANEEVDAVITEWEMFFIDDNKPAKCDSSDHYWCQLFDVKRGSSLKYPKLSALVLPHSNADVERSRSVNNRTITKEKSKLSEESIYGLRAMTDFVTFCDPTEQRPEQVSITNHLMLAVRRSYSVYSARMNEKKRMEEIAVQKELEKKQQEEKEKNKAIMTAQKLASLEDSGRKLNTELKANSEKKTVIANLLLQDCNKKLSEAVSRSNGTKPKFRSCWMLRQRIP